MSIIILDNIIAMTKTLFFTFFFSVSSLLLFYSCSNPNNQKNTEADKTISVEKGAEIFKKKCVACHGVNGELGLNGAANLTLSSLSLQEKIEVVTHGRKTMLSFKGILQPHEIESVALYTEKLKK